VPRQSARNSVGLIVSGFGTNLLGLLSGVVLARALGPSGRGVYQYAVLFYGLAPLLFSLSLGTVFAASKTVDAALLRGSVATLLVVSTITAGLALLLEPAGLPRIAAIALAIAAPGYIMSDSAVNLALRQGRVRLVTLARWCDMGGSSVLVVALFVIHQLTVTTACFALVATTAFTTLVLWLQVWPGRPLAPPPSLWSRRRFVSTLHAKNLLGAGTLYIDQLLVALFLTHSEIGRYAVALSLSRQVSTLGALAAPLTLEWARRDRADGAFRIETLTRCLVWWTILAALGVGIFGELFFRYVFGGAYASSGKLATLLVTAAGGSGLLQVLEAYLTGLGRPDVALRSRLSSAPIVVALVVLVLLRPGAYMFALVAVGASIGPTIQDLAWLQSNGALRLRAAWQIPSLQDLRPLWQKATPNIQGPPA